jgi:quercetin dioxygenase-like cupin family protein
VSTATIIPPRAGEVIGDAPDRRVEILADHPALNATWSRFAAGREGADLHVHREHTDLFYVLEGEFTLRLGLADEQVRAPAGSLLCVPPLVVHGFRNASDGELVYLNLHTPGMQFAEYLRALRDGREFAYDQFDPPADGGRPVAEMSMSAGNGVLIDGDGVFVGRRRLEAGATPLRAGFVYVLEGSLGKAAAGTWLELDNGTGGLRAGTEGASILEIRVR